LINKSSKLYKSKLHKSCFSECFFTPHPLLQGRWEEARWEGFERFQKTSEGFRRFHKVSKGFERFRRVSKCLIQHYTGLYGYYTGIIRLLYYYHMALYGFIRVLYGYYTLIIRFERSADLLKLFEAFWIFSKPFETFGNLLTPEAEREAELEQGRATKTQKKQLIQLMQVGPILDKLI
jgi:hypothetical protein